MKEYPATSREFTLNGFSGLMYKPTLSIQAKMEDENITVSVREFVEDCTNLGSDNFENMRNDQLLSIYQDCIEFAYDLDTKNKGGDSEQKKQSS